MNIVFMIGNGFDLNAGLKTRSSDFYDYYSSVRADDKRDYVQDFLRQIHNASDDWSDFEEAFGKHGQCFTDSEQQKYLNLWQDILIVLAAWLDMKQDDQIFDQPFDDQIMEYYLAFPDHFLEEGLRKPFEELRDSFPGTHTTKIDVINFNYTNTFERLYGWQNSTMRLQSSGGALLRSIVHVHGTTQEHMVLGVDNLTQLHCPASASEQLSTQCRLLKPVANKFTQTLRAERCANIIAKADIICIYGMSLGITDQTWWRLVCERLQNSKALAIIFAKNSGVPAIIKYTAFDRRFEKAEQLLRAAGLETDANILKKVNVAFDSDMFSSFSNIASPDF